MTLLIAVHFGVACLAPVLCRWLGNRAFFLLAVAPAAAAAWLLGHARTVLTGGALEQRRPWVDVLGIDVAVHIGILQWVLALIVSVVGALVLIYCRWYFADHHPPARTAGVLTAFAGAMLGLVTADDLIALYVYWELTTVFSYLLVAHRPERGANRRAALTALLVTTFGGLAMLVGSVMLGSAAGTYAIADLLADPAVTTSHSPIVVTAVLLLLLGALTKSALIPFHFWLPGAMAAPTPVSAYLHAAAMVKAGVYLVALLSPAFADLPGWRPVLLTLGALTMVVGGWRALAQHDLKLSLAYGTVSQLGFLVTLCGLGTRAGLLAGLGMVVAHALFKAALFLVVGVIDLRAGTRDLRQLSGLGRRVPLLAGVAVLAGGSMAALPPTLGFAAKETAFEALAQLVADGDGTGVTDVPALLVTTALVAGSALTVAYTLRFLWGAFARKPGLAPTAIRPVGAIVVVPTVLAVLSLAGGFAGHLLTEAFEPYTAGGVGLTSHGIALWHGFGWPLALSVAAISMGAVMFWQRAFVERLGTGLPTIPGAQETYERLLRGLDRVAVEVTGRTQRGSLPVYLATILGVLVAVPGGVLLVVDDWPQRVVVADNAGQVAVAALITLAALLAATSRGRVRAILLVGVTGYGTALLFLLHGAPDLALTQVLVETVTLVVLVLVLRKLPKYFTSRPLRSTRWWRFAIAVLVALTVSGIAFLAAGSRQATPVSSAYPTAAYEFGYGRNIVNVTLVDIRAWDTMGEISVLVVAATGVASLIFLRRRHAAARPGRDVEANPGVWLRGSGALAPVRRSVVFEVVTRLLFPVMIMVSVWLLYAGHNAPGGGFAGGLVAGLALLVRYLAGGGAELDEAAPVDAGRVLGLGLLIAAVGMLWPVLIGGRIGQSYDAHLRLGVLGEFHLVSSLLFDIGVYLVVIGVMLDLGRTLGSGIDRQAAEASTPVVSLESAQPPGRRR